jgi:hypothetical protein
MKQKVLMRLPCDVPAIPKSPRLFHLQAFSQGINPPAPFLHGECPSIRKAPLLRPGNETSASIC